MLKTKLLHPEILKALASNGHGAKILIADGNFPFATQTTEACQKVFLNFARGQLSVTDVLTVIKDYIDVESATVMIPPDGSEQPIHLEFRKILDDGTNFLELKRTDFYQQVKSEDTCLAIATGDTRRFANISIVIGRVRSTGEL